MAIARNPPSPLIRVTVASSISEMQSHRMLPSGVHNSSARCPIANLGVVPMPIRPGSYWRNPLWWVIRSRANVVHDCPSGGMNWRSSWHTGHWAGGVSLGGYCVPQLEQMNAGIVFPVWSHLDRKWTSVRVRRPGGNAIVFSYCMGFAAIFREWFAFACSSPLLQRLMLAKAMQFDLSAISDHLTV